MRAPVAALALLLILPPAAPAQQDDTVPAGTIEVAPLPAIRPDDAPEAPEEPAAEAPADTLAGGHLGPRGTDPTPVVTGPLPTVLRPGSLTQADDGADPAAGADGADGDGTQLAAAAADDQERFKRVPLDKRTMGPIYGPSSVPIRSTATELHPGAQLRQLDKMTGKRVTFDLAVGKSWQDERMRVSLDACRAPADGDTHGTMAFLRIWDTRRADGYPVFSGWMFADSPALSALDHPRYDFWVISCTTSDGVASATE